MGRILECPCTNDSYLLLLLSLVILRIQVWYTAAVNAATREASETLDGRDANTIDSHLKFMLPSSWTDLDDDDDESQGEDKRRIFVQHVLSRLTGLQILISRLFQCIANAEAESSLSATLALAAQGPLCPVLKGQIPIVPFSFPLLRALLSDVHGRLGRLSRAVAEKLRA
ncbi:hypothetical protein BJ878DRAFT_541098 [Calycina marina]|uniref:Aflatoxin regulatory protein domain-containing protein n=1 Tax=Calycina marina TaxID=1763456 RepID=A0A9P7Z681_9HELO|nr:hypothetical protein BJ878DRAFT_541098 [Calycina marina]